MVNVGAKEHGPCYHFWDDAKCRIGEVKGASCTAQMEGYKKFLSKLFH